MTGLPERRRSKVESTWKPGADVDKSGGEESLSELERVRRAVWEGKFLILSSQKQGVVDE